MYLSMPNVKCTNTSFFKWKRKKSLQIYLHWNNHWNKKIINYNSFYSYKWIPEWTSQNKTWQKPMYMYIRCIMTWWSEAKQSAVKTDEWYAEVKPLPPSYCHDAVWWYWKYLYSTQSVRDCTAAEFAFLGTVLQVFVLSFLSCLCNHRSAVQLWFSVRADCSNIANTVDSLLLLLITSQRLVLPFNEIDNFSSGEKFVLEAFFLAVEDEVSLLETWQYNKLCTDCNTNAHYILMEWDGL